MRNTISRAPSRLRLLASLCVGLTWLFAPQVSIADQVIPDDLIVQGSICTGFDCVNNESFGFDTIRLKENNLRIKFEDTSVGTFPTNDWQLIANDSASGGASKFSIEDITGAKVPFTITAGAATNSIFVDSTGLAWISLTSYSPLRFVACLRDHRGLHYTTVLPFPEIALGAMQMQLLRKVEELTLYTIQQDKKFTALQDQNQKLAVENAQLQTRLSAMESAVKKLGQR